MHKAVTLMQSSNAKILQNLSVYVYKYFQIRNETLFNPRFNVLFFHADSFMICINLHLCRNTPEQVFYFFWERMCPRFVKDL